MRLNLPAAAPLRLIEPVLQPRIWGRHDLGDWYPGRALEPEAIGEAWLTPPGAPVLVKLLFPAERLSVQVHPGDDYAATHALGRGKSEAWYVAEASADARLGVGLRAGVDWADLAPACRASRAAELLNWLPVAVGDVVNVPAGTVHAVGPGVVLCEVQQPSDNTFRLDDYGRSRPLHLEQGLAVARPTAAGRVAHGLQAGQSGCLLATEHFQLWRHCLAGGQTLRAIAAGREMRWLVNIGAGGAIPRGWCAQCPSTGCAYEAASATTLLEVRSVAGQERHVETEKG